MSDEPTARSANDRRYRPHLDGLRAVAVYLVVAFHAGLGLFTGGFVGVDVFFVLSGYLVTSILLRDIASRGRVDWRQFYARRARRILPAALVTLAVSAVAYVIVATPAQALDVVGGFRAAFCYVANWYFIHQSADYFAPNVTGSPVLHFWSLAVEEQFYLLWPLALSAVYLIARRADRHRWWVMRGVIGVAAIASAVEALHIGATNLNRAYYGTDTRAYQLLAGALIALTPQLLRLGPRARSAARVAAPAALLALVVLASSALDQSAITRGVWVTVCAGVLIVALENSRGSGTGRFLSTRPLSYLGRISYGTYLWHWPIVVLLAFGPQRSAVERFVIVLPAATVLAAISFRFLEHPIRVSTYLHRHRVPVIAIGLATSLVSGLVLAPAVLDRGGSSGSIVAPGPGPRTGPVLLDWRKAKNDIAFPPVCLGRPLDPCILVRGTGPRVLLMGDSHADMWMPAMVAIAKRESWTLMIASHVSCAWQLGFQLLRTSSYVPVCRKEEHDWYTRVVPQFAPNIVVLAEQAPDDPRFPLPLVDQNGHPVKPGDPYLERTLVYATATSLTALRKPGRRVVILEPIPLASVNVDPIPCLSAGGPESKCAYQANLKPTPLEQYFRKAARADPDVVSLDLDHLVCPRWPTCDPVLGNIIVKRDRSHLTLTFAGSLADQIDTMLRRSGVIASKP